MMDRFKVKPSDFKYILWCGGIINKYAKHKQNKRSTNPQTEGECTGRGC